MNGSRPRLKVLRYAVGAALAAIALWASLRSVSHDALRDAIHSASLSWTVAALGATLATLALVTWRWGLLLGAGRAGYWGRLWDAVVIGQAVNIVFPLRFGEAARVASMARSTGWAIGRLTAALAVERVCDGAAFAALIFLLVGSGRLPARFADPLPTMVTVLVLTVSVAIAGIILLPKVARLFPSARTRGATRWLSDQAAAADQAWRLLRGRRLLAIVLLTGLVLVSSASVNYLVFRAFAFEVPAVAAFVLLAALQIGTAVVSVPGNVGIFQYLVVVTLAAWNISESRALAASLVLHVVSLGTRVVLGALAAVLGRRLESAP